MASLLLRNLKTVVTCDDADAILEGVDLYCEDGVIRAIGRGLPQSADTVVDGTHFWCYPGLINTHHHLYQIFSRNLPQVQNLELFPWLTALYGIWKGLDREVVRLSSLAGLGELMKHGCTTCFDHHYVFPAGAGDLLEAQFAAAEELGMRMAASRGSMDLSRKDGGLPPDSVVQTVDEIMRDSARVYAIFGRFLFASLSASVLDLALFTLLIWLLKPRFAAPTAAIFLCTVLARVCSASYNYYINHRVVFRSQAGYQRAAVRYFALAVVQMLASAGLVSLITVGLLGAPEAAELPVKILVDVVLFFLSFQIQREFVYKKKAG